ncbi:MAG: UDP-N-acetylmuramoyl-L-alanine--D-glutamate ligase [Nitrospinae bacterium]|nr:UDP-N-acetylmuramoyl-L-alanine--D-glutamate ligase [Nitrospinota bacterium]
MTKLKQFIEENNNKNIHIAGFSSAEGSAILEFLIMSGFKNLTLHDSQSEENLFTSFQETHKELGTDELKTKYEKLKNLPYKTYFQENYLEGIENADLIFVSQAWYKYSSNDKMKGLQGKIPFINMTNLYLELSPCKIIGITGTNGKSSTAKLISDMYSASNFTSYFAGNDRLNRQVLDKLHLMKEDEYLILEMSNRQLMSVSSSPNIAVYTNLTPDHFDDHGSIENYYAVKQNLIHFQKPNDLAIINLDDSVILGFAKLTPAKKLYYSLHHDLEKEKIEGAYLKDNIICLNIKGRVTEIINKDELSLKGSHNLSNAMTAILASYHEEIPVATIVETLKAHKGLRYRNQFVKTIRGIHYYNDLNSTVPEATIAAMSTFEEKDIFLILGGEDKGLDYSKLAQYIVERGRTKVILLPGTGTDKILRELHKENASKETIILKECLDDAVIYADTSGKPEDIVLLSPACAYFFSRYTRLVTHGDESWLDVISQ